MITAISIILLLATILFDYLACRHIARHTSSKTLARIIISFCAITDSLPLVVVALMSGLFFGDNSPCLSDAAMWTTTLYCLTTLPRLALYVGLSIFRNRTVARISGAVLATAVFALLLVSITNTRTNLVVKSLRLQYDNLPPSFDGYRIALISDLHIGAMLDAPKYTRHIVDTLNSLRADMVVFGGDLVNIRHTELSAPIEHILSAIRATDGVVAVLGNHDTGIYIKDTLATPRPENTERVCASMRRMGWRLLRDSTIYVHRNNDSIAVTGLDFPDSLLVLRHKFSFDESVYDLSRVYADIPTSTFDITVSHMPQLWHEIMAVGRGDLVLSGHVHAAQMKAEWHSLRLSPAMLMYKEWSGLYEADGRRLYINDGIGNVGFYMRIGARPEITVLELCN